MRHRKNKSRIGKNSGHNSMLQKNLAVSLIMNNKIKTTKKRAMIARSLVEKVITTSKNKNLHTKRFIHNLLKNNAAEGKVIKELSAKYKDRPGGYTRITKIENRQGDNAKVVQIELV